MSVLKTASVVWWLEFLASEQRCIVFPVRYELNLYMLRRSIRDLYRGIIGFKREYQQRNNLVKDEN
jgi:hypothetical protein